jgi:hypothetical protein
MSLRLTSSMILLSLLTAGCQASYRDVRVRSVDTTSQLILPGVEVRVAPEGSPGEGAAGGVTNEHGQFDLGVLRSGETVLLTKPGYEPAVIRIGLGDYRVFSPASDSTYNRYALRDAEAIPVPLHRVGAVRRPPTTAPVR